MRREEGSERHGRCDTKRKLTCGLSISFEDSMICETRRSRDSILASPWSVLLLQILQKRYSSRRSIGLLLAFRETKKARSETASVQFQCSALTMRMIPCQRPLIMLTSSFSGSRMSLGDWEMVNSPGEAFDSMVGYEK